jgi:hypothetical protein
MAFEKLCDELEKRSRREITVCVFHTRLAGKTAYALSISQHGLFVVMSQSERVKHIQLITMKLKGGETRYDAQIHVIAEDDVRKMAFVTMEFFYEGLRGGEREELYEAFPDLSRTQDTVTIQRQEVDLSGFLT